MLQTTSLRRLEFGTIISTAEYNVRQVTGQRKTASVVHVH